MNKPLIGLVDRKIQEMERYKEITNRMIYEDIDGVEELMGECQKIITVMDGISVDIKQYINEQSVERKEKLEKLMNFEDIGALNGELLELQEKIKRTNELRLQIIESNRAAYNHLAEMQEELKEKLGESAKGKQVINYFSGTNTNVNKGKKLNISN
ncbi:MAG: hypothetical protein K2H90_01535 [Oscillospiraceae bacterium]|nr:hypothetical protein [Oscillospiraceae bacterium]MDE6132060.1 hypothetical protein [Oscillospiraceae bacterium]